MKQFKFIRKGRYTIATYIKPEIIRNLDYIGFQELGREAVEKVLRMKEEDVIAVPEEKIKETLRDAVWKAIYVDMETHEKWIGFPRRFKSCLHYWINIKLEELLKEQPVKQTEEKEKKGENSLVFYLFGSAIELYQKGLITGNTILTVLQELYENQHEIEPLTKKEFTKLKEQLGEAVKVYVNFKHHQELREWYINLPNELKRGVWVKTNELLLDKLRKLWYNILHQNQ
jgi:hypothetical protein